MGVGGLEGQKNAPSKRAKGFLVATDIVDGALLDGYAVTGDDEHDKAASCSRRDRR